jgi:hypothetical protein
MDASCHIRSAWPTPISKPLTNALITRRMKEGFYGEVAKQRALDRTRRKDGLIDRCACGQLKGVRFYAYSYLEKPGFYCLTCIARLRGTKVRVKTHGSSKPLDPNEFI